MPAQLSAPRRVNPCTFSLACRCPMQNGSLPLQLALRNGESIEVVAALLAAHPQAEAEVDSAEHRGMLERAKAHGQSTTAALLAAEAGGSSTASDPFAHTVASSADCQPSQLLLEALVMQEKRMCSAVAVTVGNRHVGQVDGEGRSRQSDGHLSAQQLNAALQGRGLRVEAPWIDQPGGEPMLERLRQVLASEVRPTDDGFVFCFCGHGRATELFGNNNVPTPYQAILHAIDAEPKLTGKPKLVVFDCGASAQLRIPKDMIIARSTSAGSVAYAQNGVVNVYSNRLAATIRSHAATHSVEDLLKLTQDTLLTLTPQVALVESALGAYHLFLGVLSAAEAAAALVAALEAHAPEAKVLPLITKEAAAEKDQVSLHSYPYLTRAVRALVSCTVPQPSELELTL